MMSFYQLHMVYMLMYLLQNMIPKDMVAMRTHNDTKHHDGRFTFGHEMHRVESIEASRYVPGSHEEHLSTAPTE
jgi:hypothetical protein